MTGPILAEIEEGLGVAARRRRQAIADAARSAHLGEVVRVHREHSGLVAAVLWTLAMLSIPPAVIVSIIMWAEQTTPTWQWPLFASAALAGAAYVGAHVGPVLDGRRWIAVAEGGLVVWQRDRVETFDWNQAHNIDVGSVCNLGDLRESIAQRRPVGAWTRRRITGLTITALVTAVAVWFTAIPMALHVFVGDRPTSLTHLARMCDGGAPFGRTAAYTGPAPHPVALYTDRSGDYPEWYSDPQPEPDAVQLVGCVRLTVGASPKDLGTCRYTEGYTQQFYQGRFRIDIYEARTGRRVTSINLDGTVDDSPCVPWVYVSPGAKDVTRTIYTYPSQEGYAAQLNPLVNG